MGTSSPQRSSVFRRSVNTVEGSSGDWTKDSFVKVTYSFLSSRVNTLKKKDCAFGNIGLIIFPSIIFA